MGERAVRLLVERFHGVSADPVLGETLHRVGERFSSRAEIGQFPYRLHVHLVNDQWIADGFALPGGHIVLTVGLMRQLHSDGEVAAILGHLIGHVVARHGLIRLARSTIHDGLIGATAMASFEQGDRSPSSDRLVEELADMTFERSEELEADTLGLRLMSEAGYDPRAMLGVMGRLEEGQRWGAAFLGTHPSPDNRVERIRVAIRHIYPDGIPGGLDN